VASSVRGQAARGADAERGWRAYLTDEEDEPAEALVYCPEMHGAGVRCSRLGRRAALSLRRPSVR
jgi:hypothetical protein